MSAGTLTLVNNSVNVVGVGTAFTTDLKVNDFVAVVVGGATYTMAVKSITNATNLVVTRPYAGPSQSGVAWSAVPNGTMLGITVKVAEDTSYTMRMYVNEATNWMNLLTVNGDVTVTAPDGSTYTGPSWLKVGANALMKSANLNDLADKNIAKSNLSIDRFTQTTTDTLMKTVNTKYQFTIKETGNIWGVWDATLQAWNPLSIASGGTGGGDVGTANTSLGTFFNRNGNVPQDAVSLNNYAGPLGSGGEVYSVNATNSNTIADWPTTAFSTTNRAYGWGGLYNIRCAQGSQTGIQTYMGDDTSGSMFIRIRYGNAGFRPWAALLSDRNTTADSNGFIKRASPIVQIFSDGSSVTNDESEGASVERLGIGIYKITGILGTNSDRSWGGNGGGIEVPKDVNGQLRLWVDYKVEPDGSVILYTYHRTFPDSPEFARNLIGVKNEDGTFTETVLNGDPVDIPRDVFISLRVEMPEDSVYNTNLKQRQEETIEQIKQADLEYAELVESQNKAQEELKQTDNE